MQNGDGCVTCTPTCVHMLRVLKHTPRPLEANLRARADMRCMNGVRIHKVCNPSFTVTQLCRTLRCRAPRIYAPR